MKGAEITGIRSYEKKIQGNDKEGGETQMREMREELDDWLLETSGYGEKKGKPAIMRE